MRQNIPGSSPFEPVIGFSRAVRVGDAVHISGTGPVGADAADAAAQTRHILSIIQNALEKAGAKLEDVVRTRMYLTHAEDWESIGRVHGEFFGSIRPAATMVVVAKLLNPSWRVEIEADAVISSVENIPPTSKIVK
ncbi:MAG TPA: RidA family protein [Pseudacidobacterium sp.]|jgi:enamine deaminase RidA (YjgF/YER057c/UK114 family)|nr:RidA family protein [Pseudacidobacterium sp.]